MKKQLTVEEIVNKVVEHYKTNPRGLNAEKRCVYITEAGATCAVGLCCFKSKLKRLPESTLSSDVESLFRVAGEEILRPEFRGHELEFWETLQDLHDYDSNWYDTEGERRLTNKGKLVVESIINKYGI